MGVLTNYFTVFNEADRAKEKKLSTEVEKKKLAKNSYLHSVLMQEPSLVPLVVVYQNTFILLVYA